MPACGPEISGWAGRILDSLPETGNASVGSIATYLQYNLYQLNYRTNSDFALSGECVYPDMTPMLSGIYESIYRCEYYAKAAARNLGVAGYEFVEIEGHDQGRFRTVAKTTIAQGYQAQYKECKLSLAELIEWYNSQGAGLPSLGMVINAERGPNFATLPDFSCIPRYDYFHDCNTVFGSYFIG